MTVLQIMEIYPDIPLILEVCLIAVIIALVGAVGYTVFVLSMQNDYDDRGQEWQMTPWDYLNGENPEDIPQKRSRKKGYKVWLGLAIAILFILLFFILAIKFGWIAI